MNLYNGLIKQLYYTYFINEETWNDKDWIIWLILPSPSFQSLRKTLESACERESLRLFGLGSTRNAFCLNITHIQSLKRTLSWPNQVHLQATGQLSVLEGRAAVLDSEPIYNSNSCLSKHINYSCHTDYPISQICLYQVLIKCLLII